MQKLIFGGEEFHRLYNCSFYNVSDIPLEQRRNIPLGVAEIIISSIEFLLYIPCMISIWWNREISCYKILFVMGVMDMMNLAIHGSISGYFTIAGTVFCSCPTFMYILGCISTGLYVGEKIVEILVAINRLLYFAAENTARKIFREKSDRTWLYTIPPILYTLLYIMFGQTSSFSGISHNWMWNPHTDYVPEMNDFYMGGFKTFWNTLNECFVMIALPAIYITFTLLVKKQRAMIESDNSQYINTRAAFLQVFLISFANFATCVMFFVNNYITSGEYPILNVIHLWSSMQIHGLPPIIYLWLNTTIQEDCLTMLEMLVNKLS